MTVNNNSPIQDNDHPDDQTQATFEMTLGFKTFTIVTNTVLNFGSGRQTATTLYIIPHCFLFMTLLL